MRKPRATIDWPFLPLENTETDETHHSQIEEDEIPILEVSEENENSC